MCERRESDIMPWLKWGGTSLRFYNKRLVKSWITIVFENHPKMSYLTKIPKRMLHIENAKTCPWISWWLNLLGSHLNVLTIGPRGFSELIIQPPKIDFDILLGAKSVGSRGLFAKDQNHRFNQRFSTLLLLTFDLTLLQQWKALELGIEEGTLAFLQLFLHPSSSFGERLLGGNLSSNYR